jgi:DNA-binding response OmpR family regulator
MNNNTDGSNDAHTGQADASTGNFFMASHKLSKYTNLVYVFVNEASAAGRFADHLRWYHHEIVAFSSHDEFLAAVALRRPQAAVLDIDSEAGNALAHCLAIAQNQNQDHEQNGTSSNQQAQSAAHFPVIYVSQDDQFPERLRAVHNGAEGYFSKPVDFNALSIRIDQKISKNQILAFRILVVDDDEMLGTYYEAVLNSAGMHVKALSDPSQVLDAMKRFKPDLVLTDLQMPVCNGIDLAKIIRQNNLYTNVPIVFLSSVTEEDKQLSAFETGADDFLIKPIDPEKLIAAVVNRAERYRSLRA